MERYRYFSPIDQKELDTILALSKQGLTNAEIGKRLGRSEATIQSKLWQYKHGHVKSVQRDMRPWTIKELNEIRTVIEEGGTIWQASKKIGRKYSTVYKEIEKMGNDFYDSSKWYKHGMEC